jgi:hypothetical protein
MARNPLRRSDAMVRAWLLEEMPVGRSSEQVRAFAKAQGWFDPFRQRGDGAAYGPYIRGSWADAGRGGPRVCQCDLGVRFKQPAGPCPNSEEYEKAITGPTPTRWNMPDALCTTRPQDAPVCVTTVDREML